MTTYKSVDEYIAAQPREIAERLEQVRSIFHEVLDNTQESIRYDMLAFAIGERYLYVGAYKNHIGMYPMYGIPKFDKAMAPYRGKGTKDALHFKHTEPIPYELIEQIIIAKEQSRHG